MQTRLFLSNMTLVTLKIGSRSPDSNYFLRSPRMVYPYRFGQNLALKLEERVQTNDIHGDPYKN